MAETALKIEMVDLERQYLKIQSSIDEAILSVVRNQKFINGPEVREFSEKLSTYLGGVNVITCANGTDALQIAFMALDLQPGDEVIVPSFTYVATAEVIGLLKLVPVMVDVDPDTFNITADIIKQAISARTRAVVPVHLFGQCAGMEDIMELARENNLYVIEDAAQSLGAEYTFKNKVIKSAGTIGHIGCTSFFPSKNLGCYGDGGAVFTADAGLAEKIRMIANHGQNKKYSHKYIGVNSRLDTLQAAILNVKIDKLNSYLAARQAAAAKYDDAFSDIQDLRVPFRDKQTSHVFHQYTLIVPEGKRNALKNYLEKAGIPSMIYYPIPLNKQEAFSSIGISPSVPAVSEKLCKTVLSLPMHTELDNEQQKYIIENVRSFFAR